MLDIATVKYSIVFYAWKQNQLTSR